MGRMKRIATGPSPKPPVKKPKPEESTESKVERFHSCAQFLVTKFERGGGAAYIKRAVALDRKALELCPPGHPNRWATLILLQNHLWYRYNQLGALTDIEEAIVLSTEALSLCPQGHPNRSRSLSDLAVCLSARYEQLGAIADLNEAIVLGQDSLNLRPRGDPGRSISLNNLAVDLSTRYNQLGAIEDLHEAVILGRESLDLRPHGHPERSTIMNNLALNLSTRFNQLGAVTDLSEAIILDREALDLCPRGHLDRSIPLNNLAHHLFTRFQQLGVMTDLEEAIVLNREALTLRPPGHPDHSLSLNNLANNLSARFKQFREITDLDDAIFLGRQALDLRPLGHPLRSTSLRDLATSLFTRYKELGKTMDLDEATALAWDALHLRPRGNPERSQSLNDLATYIRVRFTNSGLLEDKEDLFTLYAELAHVPQVVSSSDLLATKAWVNAAEDLHHITTLVAYETSFQLLSQYLATLPSLPQHLPILRRFTSSLAADAFSACLRNGNAVRAVELLEQGRGVFWHQITRLRSPLDDVVASGPVGKTLGDEFNRLTARIRNHIGSPAADQHDRICHLNLDLQKVVAKIRELPGLERFLLPALFFHLQLAASKGPVIILNASRFTCDALIIYIDRGPVHIPMQITKSRVRDLSLEIQSLVSRAKRMDIRSDLGRFLRNLWDEVVSPIADSLRTALPVHSRIWWCPTAEFSLLPLHAAGPYRKGQRNLSNLYISSYTPTLSALIRARRKDPTVSTTNEKHFVAIGQAAAIGETKLASVGTELDIIGQRLKGLATFTRIEGPDSYISRVSEEFSKNEWVHLACHGLPNRKHPFESAFSLYDGHFTIEQIIRCELEEQQFAYLSACHTTVGDEESPDEVIHLASAMHFAGFRSVIGTMWGVDDGQTTKIASMFYTHMLDESGRLDHTRAAFALNETMKTVDVPFDQRVLYIHIGA